MGSAISLRSDCDSASLHDFAKGTKDAARLGGADLQVIGDWP